MKKLPQSDLHVPNGQRPLTRLQKRFIETGLDGLDDQDIIELLLNWSGCCRSKGLAQNCIKEFHNLRGFLTTSPEQLRQAGVAECRAFLIRRLVYELPSRILKEKLVTQPAYNSSPEFFRYFYYSMRDLNKEVFKVTYLNKRNQIIDIVDLFEGDTGLVYIRPREIIGRAIGYEAASLLFAHNHPSGDPAPSKIDKRLTRDLVSVGNILQIKVHDHIIIGDNCYFSFADAGLLQQYEDDFLNLKIRCI